MNTYRVVETDGWAQPECGIYVCLCISACVKDLNSFPFLPPSLVHKELISLDSEGLLPAWQKKELAINLLPNSPLLYSMC